MTIADWVIMASATIVALAWFITGFLDRAMRIRQTRLDYRLRALEALESILPVVHSIQNGNAPITKAGFLAQLEDTRGKFQIYGLKDEIAIMEKYVLAIEKQDVKVANAALGKLVPLVRARLRKELNINN